MSADPVSESTHPTDDDELARLGVIEHRLHQILTHLAATMGQLRSQLAEIHAHLETLIGSLGPAELIKERAACGLPDLELPSSPTAIPALRCPGVELVDGITGVRYRVSSDELLASRRAGEYHALHGVRVLAASLTDRGQWCCTECAR
jgi:hypothetical protein